MRALHILAVVILVLLLIGQIRVGGRAEFNARGFFLWIRLGRFKIKILPAESKKEKPAKPQKPRKKASRELKEEKPPAPLPEKLGGALTYARELLPVGLEAAKGMWRGLRVDTLELELTAGSPDPADAAMVYGQANAALGALWHPLTKAFHVKDGAARVKLDFDAPGTTVYGTAALSVKIGTVTWIGLRAGVKALSGILAANKRLKLKRRKAA